MPLSEIDHPSVYSFLSGLEKGTKSIPGMGGNTHMRGMVHSSVGGGGGYGSFLRQFLPGSDYDYHAQAGDLWRNSAVAACLRVFKVNFPQPELQVRRLKGKGRDQVIIGHRLVKLINKPNRGYDRYAMWAAFCSAAVTDGNGYLLKIRSAAGIPVELWWIPPWLLRPLWRTDGSDFITCYQYTVNGRVYLIPPQDIIHFRHGGPDPRNDRVAMSDLKSAAARSVCGLNEVDTYTAAIMRNMGIVPVVIEPAFEGGRISIDDADNIKDQWRERTTGEKRGEPFVNPGAFKVTKLGTSPEDMALKVIPNRFEDQVSSLTGVPAMLAGLTSATSKTYKNYAEARRSFYEDTLIPMQGAVAECLEFNLLDDPGMGDSESQEIIFSYEGIFCLREEQDSLWRRAEDGYEKHLIRRSEARDMLGLGWDPEDDEYAPMMPGQYSDQEKGISPNKEPNLPSLGHQRAAADPGTGEPNEGEEPENRAMPKPKRATKALPSPSTNGEGEDRDPFSDIPTAAKLLARSLKSLGHSQSYLDETISADQRRAVLHHLRLGAREWLRAEAVALTEELGYTVATKGLTGDAAAKVKRLFKRAGEFVDRSVRAAVTLMLGAGDKEPIVLEGAERDIAGQRGFLDLFESEVMNEGFVDLGVLEAPIGDELAPPVVQPTPSGFSPARFAARLELYGGAVWTSGINATRNRAIGAVVFDEELGQHIGKDKPCDDCVRREKKGWSPIGSLDPIGDSECGGMCHCILLYRNSSTGVTYDAGPLSYLERHD